MKFWLSLQINAKTPADVVGKYRNALYQVFENKEYVAALNARGAEAFALEPSKVQDFVQQDTVKWEALGKELNIQPV